MFIILLLIIFSLQYKKKATLIKKSPFKYQKQILFRDTLFLFIFQYVNSFFITAVIYLHIVCKGTNYFYFSKIFFHFIFLIFLMMFWHLDFQGLMIILFDNLVLLLLFYLTFHKFLLYYNMLQYMNYLLLLLLKNNLTQ